MPCKHLRCRGHGRVKARVVDREIERELPAQVEAKRRLPRSWAGLTSADREPHRVGRYRRPSGFSRGSSRRRARTRALDQLERRRRAPHRSACARQSARALRCPAPPRRRASGSSQRSAPSIHRADRVPSQARANARRRGAPCRREEPSAEANERWRSGACPTPSPSSSSSRAVSSSEPTGCAASGSTPRRCGLEVTSWS